MESELDEKLIKDQHLVLQNNEYSFEFSTIDIGNVFGDMRKNGGELQIIIFKIRVLLIMKFLTRGWKKKQNRSQILKFHNWFWYRNQQIFKSFWEYYFKIKVRGRGRSHDIFSCDKTELNNAEKVTSKGVDVTFKSDQESTQMDTPKPSADTEQDDERKNQFAFDTESNMLQHNRKFYWFDWIIEGFFSTD